MTERAKKAKELFQSGYNCAQAVTGAFADAFDLDANTLMRLAEGLGGGMGRMRLTCGAVSGMAMLAGLKYSRAEAGDLVSRTRVYAATREMAEEFKAKNGSVICAELLGANMPKDKNAAPQERTKEYYKKRPCADIVADCAEIAERELFGEEAH